MKLDRVSRRPRCPLWAALLVALWAMLGSAAAYGHHLTHVKAPMCLFKRLTHLACPTCGFTRGVMCLLAGRVTLAWTFNPMLFSALSVLLAVLLLRVGFGRAVTIRATRRERCVAWLLAAVLFVANWVYVVLCVG